MAVLGIIYAVGVLGMMLVGVPALVQGPVGRLLYQVCVMHPPSWRLGIPFCIAGAVVTILWPVTVPVWLVLGRPLPPVIFAPAYAERFGAPDEDGTPILRRVPAPSREFWEVYFSDPLV